MPKRDDAKQPVRRRRPSFFWWSLALLLAAAFAVTSWTVCLYLFNFPERPSNYDLLRKLGRIEPIQSWPALEAPEGSTVEAPALLNKFFPMESEALDAHNLYFKRNFITNFKKPREDVVLYVEGLFQVTHARTLTEGDYFHPGLAVRAHATIQGPELLEPAPYPVIIELLLPLAGEPATAIFKEGDLLDLKMLDHRAVILHATQLGSPAEPEVCLTLVPLAYENYRDPPGKKLPLAPPDPLLLTAPFPVMEANRRD